MTVSGQFQREIVHELAWNIAKDYLCSLAAQNQGIHSGATTDAQPRKLEMVCSLACTPTLLGSFPGRLANALPKQQVGVNSTFVYDVVDAYDRDPPLFTTYIKPIKSIHKLPRNPKSNEIQKRWYNQYTPAVPYCGIPSPV